MEQDLKPQTKTGCAYMYLQEQPIMQCDNVTTGFVCNKATHRVGLTVL